MPLFYFDTSAILKRYKSERGSGFIDELIEQRKSDEIFLSSLLTAVEVFSVASRMLKGKLLTKAEKVVNFQNEAGEKGGTPSVITVSVDEKPGLQAIKNIAPDIMPEPGKQSA